MSRRRGRRRPLSAHGTPRWRRSACRSGRSPPRAPRTARDRSPPPCPRRSPPPHTGARPRRWGRPALRSGRRPWRHLSPPPPVPFPSGACRTRPVVTGGTGRLGRHVRTPRDRHRRRAETPRGTQRPVAHGQDRQPLQAARRSSSRRPRSTAASARPTTTARSGSCCCATSRTPGGGRWCSAATTWSASTPRSCRRRRSGRPRATSPNFTDPLVDCRSATSGSARTSSTTPPLPELRRGGQLHRGPPVQPHVQDPGRAGRGPKAAVAYLRPETAQGMFINFANVLYTSRKKPPFGIAQIGKTFRNEITPGNFVFRTREFEQMELEFFVPPDEAGHWYEYWCQQRCQWYLDLGIPEDKLRLRPHDVDELSHYSDRARPTSSSSSRGAGASSKASPTGATTTSPSTPAHSGDEARLLRSGHQRAGTCPTSSSRRPAPPAR